ncbi:hypothetical protein GCM10023322_26620 [Rugosimonospora acidiphila]|uniref:Uncharacterized protein n=1 Tax=Rugosimonospora acidiphila TaxID=556531 RepID=A0ABP9RRP6_9ACTN
MSATRLLDRVGGPAKARHEYFEGMNYLADTAIRRSGEWPRSTIAYRAGVADSATCVSFGVHEFSAGSRSGSDNLSLCGWSATRRRGKGTGEMTRMDAPSCARPDTYGAA